MPEQTSALEGWVDTQLRMSADFVTNHVKAVSPATQLDMRVPVLREANEVGEERRGADDEAQASLRDEAYVMEPNEQFVASNSTPDTCRSEHEHSSPSAPAHKVLVTNSPSDRNLLVPAPPLSVRQLAAKFADKPMQLEVLEWDGKITRVLKGHFVGR